MSKPELLEKCSRGGVAYALGLSPSQISRLRRQGLPANADNKTFDLRAVFAWAAEREAATASSTAESAETLDALARWRGWKCRREELAFKRESAELVPVAELEAEWAGRARLVTAGLQGLCERLPAALAGKSRREVEELLRFEVELVLLRFLRAGAETPRTEEIDQLIAELQHRGTSSHKARVDASRIQSAVPSWLKWDPTRGLYIDTRDGTEVSADEGHDYVRRWPYIEHKEKSQ